MWIGPSEDPDDLVQEALARTLRLRPLSELEEPEVYLRTVIANIARNSRRRPSHLGSADELDAVSVIQSYPSDLSVLQSLRPADRAALFLVDVEQYGYAGSARVLGCSIPALYGRVSRARRRLRQVIHEEESS